MGTYIAACTRKDVKWVASIEKADVLAYLRGQTDSAVQVRFGVFVFVGVAFRWCGMLSFWFPLVSFTGVHSVKHK